MKYFSLELKSFFKHFIIPIVIVLVIVASYFIVKNAKGDRPSYVESTNIERIYPNQRVFDYGNQLTDEEEQRLEDYIQSAEKVTALDIVIVTLDESLEEWAKSIDPNVAPSRYVKIYGDAFWEENKFGYDEPLILNGKYNGTGDGILLVDNVYREPQCYTWMVTTGKAEGAYSNNDIDYALDRFYDNVEYDYYTACTDFVDAIVRKMGPKNYTKGIWPYVVSSVFALIYLACNIGSKKGTDTTTASSYVIGGSLSFPSSSDRFLRKSVTKRYNPPSSSSSGGGGHHISSGGGSHGGGGHSR